MTIKNRHEKERHQQAPKLLELDAAVVSQTKSQISTIVADIAAMAGKSLELQEYVRELLPKVVSAMAASGAAFWNVDSDGQWQLVGHVNLPFRLLDENLDESALLDQVESLLEEAIQTPSNRHQTAFEARQPREASSNNPFSLASSKFARPSKLHQRLLDQVAREMQPVLIPPGDSAAFDDRPTNPTDEFLIYVPVPVEAILGRWWLQVIQPPSGGVATQRGYLRFVAQIADLVADFLKSCRLRAFEQQSQLFRLSERLFEHVSHDLSEKKLLQSMIQSLRELTAADQVFLMHRSSLREMWHITATSSMQEVDRASEGMKCISDAVNEVVALCPVDGTWYRLSRDRREPASKDPATAIDRFNAVFASALSGWIPLVGADQNSQTGIGVLVYWSWPSDRPDQKRLVELLPNAQRLARIALKIINPSSMINAFESVHPKMGFLKRLVFQSFQSLAMRVILGCLALVAIALIPVPLTLRAPATLEPVAQTRYYAPSDSQIKSIYVDYGDRVTAGQVLLELEDRNLSALLDDAIANQVKSLQRQHEVEIRLLREDQLPSSTRHELEAELETLRAISNHQESRVDYLRTKAETLIVRAKEDGVVATWNAKQLLADRPVRVGQWLLAVYQEEGPWMVEARIPEHQVGRFIDTARASQASTMDASVILDSHPMNTIPAVYSDSLSCASLTTLGPNGNQSELLVRFNVPVSSLPHRSAGAAAQLKLSMGRGVLIQSLCGDALAKVWAKVRLWL